MRKWKVQIGKEPLNSWIIRLGSSNPLSKEYISLKCCETKWGHLSVTCFQEVPPVKCVFLSWEIICNVEGNISGSSSSFITVLSCLTHCRIERLHGGHINNTLQHLLHPVCSQGDALPETTWVWASAIWCSPSPVLKCFMTCPLLQEYCIERMLSMDWPLVSFRSNVRQPLVPLVQSYIWCISKWLNGTHYFIIIHVVISVQRM